MSALLKKLKITLTLVACSASFAVMAQDKLLVGVDTAFVPFEFKQGNKYVGFDIDLWEAIAKKMNVSYELRPMDFGNDSNLMIVFYVQIMPDDLVMQLHRF